MKYSEMLNLIERQIYNQSRILENARAQRNPHLDPIKRNVEVYTALLKLLRQGIRDKQKTLFDIHIENKS